MDLSPPGLHGTSVGLVYAGTMAVGALGAALGGLVADALSIESTFIFAGITNVTAAFLLLIVRTRAQRN
jgi:predicted MFS family arabinose efflux permease